MQLLFYFRATFHQNDDDKTNILSYEARIYSINILGVDKGPAKFCVKCLKGSQLSADGSTCEKCAVGTYSADGRKCIPCPAGHFTDKVYFLVKNIAIFLRSWIMYWVHLRNSTYHFRSRILSFFLHLLILVFLHALNVLSN